MIIKTKNYKSSNDINILINFLEKGNYKYHIICENQYKSILVYDDNIDKNLLSNFKCISDIINISTKFKLCSREYKKDNTVININGISIGGNNKVMIAGPCAIEDEKSYINSAIKIAEAGGQILRGAIFKPRTSPYDFQGIGEVGIDVLKRAKYETGLSIVTEVMDVSMIEKVSEVSDIIQVGSRNMQNFTMLKTLGGLNKPILLKRGLSSTIEEWLLAAEYILLEGNSQVILCERGIRSFENWTRNTLDLAAVSLVKNISHLPIIVDPSHATGNRKLINPMSKAAIVSGADGLMIEVYDSPDNSICDAKQTINIDEFRNIIKELEELKRVI